MKVQEISAPIVLTDRQKAFFENRDKKVPTTQNEFSFWVMQARSVGQQIDDTPRDVQQNAQTFTDASSLQEETSAEDFALPAK